MAMACSSSSILNDATDWKVFHKRSERTYYFRLKEKHYKATVIGTLQSVYQYDPSTVERKPYPNNYCLVNTWFDQAGSVRSKAVNPITSWEENNLRGNYKKEYETLWLNDPNSVLKSFLSDSEKIAFSLLKKEDVRSHLDGFAVKQDPVKKARTGQLKKAEQEKYPVTPLLAPERKAVAKIRTNSPSVAPAIPPKPYVPVISNQASDKSTRRKDARNDAVRDEAMHKVLQKNDVTKQEPIKSDSKILSKSSKPAAPSKKHSLQNRKETQLKPTLPPKPKLDLTSKPKLDPTSKPKLMPKPNLRPQTQPLSSPQTSSGLARRTSNTKLNSPG